MRLNEYCYVDGEDNSRVRWTNRVTGKEHSYTCAGPKEARTLGGYLLHWEGCVDRKSHVFKTGAWKNDFPDPNNVAAGQTLGEYATGVIDELFARKRITQRSHTIKLTELERMRVPLSEGPSLFDTPVTALTDAKRIIERFEAALCTVEWAEGKTYSSHTVTQTISCAIGMIRRVAEDKLIPRDALGDYKAPKGQRRQAKRAIEWSDYLGLREHEADADVRLMFDVIAGTGCRISELLGIRAVDVIVTNSTCMIRFMGQEYRDKTRHPLKSTRYKRPGAPPYRDVRIARWLGDALMAFIRHHGRTGSLFLSPQVSRNRTWSHEGFEHRFKKAAKAAIAAGDMPLWADHTYIPTPHNLRHSYVSWALGNRLSPETIAKRTGHSSQTLLSVYAESLSESEDAMDSHLESLNPSVVSRVTTDACCAHCGLPGAA